MFVILILSTLAAVTGAVPPLSYSQPHHRSVPATDIVSFPNPNTDPFYTAPANVSSYDAGDIINSRPVFTTVTGRSVESYQLFYRTTDALGDAVGTVATLWMPAVAATPPKILSFQTAEDSTNLACAPSWAWANASSTLEPSAIQEASIIIPWALAQGYYVVNSDFEGPNSAWLVGLMEGQAVLDGIRAAENHVNCTNGDSAVALYGYSGAAQASVWAASLSMSYAPELNIVGAAFGGTPVDLQAQYDLINGSPFTILGGGAYLGLGNAYPRFKRIIQSLLTEKGKQIFKQLEDPDFCIIANPLLHAGLDFTSLFHEDPLSVPLISRLLADQALLSNISSLAVPVPKFARLEYHGLNDTVAPVKPEIEYVAQQCASGADIRFVLFPGMDHNPAHWNGLAGALGFVAEAFEGKISSSPCGSNITLPALGSNQTIELLGLDDSILVETLYTLSVKALAAL